MMRIAVLAGKVFLIAFVGLFISFMVLSSCTAYYRDVSSERKHAKRVGQRCVVLKGLRAHGFTLDLRKRDVTHEVAVTTMPGIGGPEITFTAPVPKGTTLVVTSVRECWNCPFDRISYGIAIRDIPRLAPYMIYARAEALAPDEVECFEKR